MPPRRFSARKHRSRQQRGNAPSSATMWMVVAPAGAGPAFDHAAGQADGKNQKNQGSKKTTHGDSRKVRKSPLRQGVSQSGVGDSSFGTNECTDRVNNRPAGSFQLAQIRREPCPLRPRSLSSGRALRGPVWGTCPRCARGRKVEGGVCAAVFSCPSSGEVPPQAAEGALREAISRFEENFTSDCSDAG